jgi:hypothetical protein
MKYAVTLFFLLLLSAGILTKYGVNNEQDNPKTEETSFQTTETPKPIHALKENFSEDSHGVPEEFQENSSQGSKTSDAIKATYSEKFKHLESTAIAEILTIAKEAMSEFQSKKQNGEEISYLYFYQTYYPKITALQKEIDTAFEEKYTELQTELITHGHPPENAEMFKVEYEEKKKQQMQQLMGVLMEGF